MRTSTGALLLTAALALTGCAVSVEPLSAPAVTPSAGAAPEAVAPSVAPSAGTGVAGSGAVSTGPAATGPATTGPATTGPAAAGTTAVPSAATTSAPAPAASVAPTAPAPDGTTTPPPAPSAPAPSAPPSASPSAEPDDGQLRPGDSGPEVLALQERLSELGYWLGTPDGSFGRLTTQAVLAVQKAAGLSRDGVVGPRTLAALEAGTRPSARGGGDGVEIDLDRQLLLVVRGGEVRTVLNTSTGVPGRYDTPPGQFRVQRAIDGLRVAPLGELWRPRYFNGGIAVHGSPSIPGYPASHGCARLSDAAIDMVWAEDLMPIGSSVTVY